MTDTANRSAGAVTLLTIDLEGSSLPVGDQPDTHRETVQRHRVLLEGVAKAHGGAVLQTAGDEIAAAFAAPAAALAAALAGQLALQQEERGVSGAATVGPLRARMGLYTEEAVSGGLHRFDAPLRHCARLAAAAHGGQVVLSGTTAARVRDALSAAPPGTSLRDLGGHRLTALERAEVVFQLVHPELPAEFPPLCLPPAVPHNLPAPPTPFVGRGPELEAVRRRLLAPEVRLLTLTGPGGTGKTRLALRVVEEALEAFPDGVWLVALAPLADPALVPTAVAQALGVQGAAGRPLHEVLRGYLRDRALLLLVDNCEHLLGAPPLPALLADLLAACPRLKVLATSRTALRLAGEHRWPVPPLALPAPGLAPPAAAALSQYDAVTLFIQRAVAVQPDFLVTNETAPAVAEICARLDGLPLAIELAAARIALLPPRELLGRLSSRLRLLTGGPRDAPARQRTLRATLEWSHALLTPEEQALFARLGVFAGGWTMAAAEAVGGLDSGGGRGGAGSTGAAGAAGAGDEADVLDGLSSLVDKSLVRREGPGASAGGEVRFGMLETVREHALERLEAGGEAAAVRRAHAGYVLGLVEAGERGLFGPEQVAWVRRLDREHDNVRAALGWAIAGGAAGDAAAAATGLRVAGALWWFWHMRGHQREARGRLQRLLALPGTDAPTVARARALFAAGVYARDLGDRPAALAAFREAADLGRALGAPLAAARPTLITGTLQHDSVDRCARFAESLPLFRAAGDAWGTGMALQFHAGELARRGDAAARPMTEEALTVHRRAGDHHAAAIAQRVLARLLANEGDLAGARTLFEESLPVLREMGDKPNLVVALIGLGRLDLDGGDPVAARARFAEALRITQGYGQVGNHAGALEGLAGVAAAVAPAHALRLAGAAARLRAAAGLPAPADDQAAHDRRLRPAWAVLGEPAGAAAWAEGEALSYEEAGVEALRDAVPVDPPRPSGGEAPGAPLPGGLSAREAEVLRLVAEGLPDATVAARLSVSPRTVHAHLRAVYGKLGVTSRSAATRWAVEHGLT